MCPANTLAWRGHGAHIVACAEAYGARTVTAIPIRDIRVRRIVSLSAKSGTDISMIISRRPGRRTAASRSAKGRFVQPTKKIPTNGPMGRTMNRAMATRRNKTGNISSIRLNPPQSADRNKPVNANNEPVNANKYELCYHQMLGFHLFPSEAG